MSLEKCVFVVIGITSRRSRGGKPTPSHKAEGSSAGGASTTKGAGLRPKAKALEEPPDPTVRASLQDTTVVDRSGACIPRGSSGTCESWLFPMWRRTGRVGVPVDQEPWRWQAVLVSQRAPRGDTQRRRDSMGIGKASEERSRRDGQPEVVAEHCTEGWRIATREGGEPRPKGPTEGTAKPGTTFCWEELQERL